MSIERVSRVHLNTQERLVMMLPPMATAACFWDPLYVAVPGLLFVLGRFVYWKGYVRWNEGLGVSVAPLAKCLVEEHGKGML